MIARAIRRTCLALLPGSEDVAEVLVGEEGRDIRSLRHADQRGRPL